MDLTMRQRLERDLQAATKKRDTTRVSILRTTLAALANAEAVDAAASRPAVGLFASDVVRRHLFEDDARIIVLRGTTLVPRPRKCNSSVR